MAAKADGGKWKHLGNRDCIDGKWTGIKLKTKKGRSSLWISIPRNAEAA